MLSPIVEFQEYRTSPGLRFLNEDALTNEDWGRFRLVSPHVRRITFPSGSRLHDTVVKRMQNSSSSSTPILPNLRELEWAGAHSSSTYFMGPSLRFLDITLLAEWRSSEGIIPVVSQIAIAAPNLTTLTLTASIPNTATVNALAGMLEPLKALSSATFSIDSEAANLIPVVSTLSQLPNLQDLVLHYFGSPVPPTWKPLLPKPFPSLRRITFTTPASTNVQQYLNYLLPSAQLTEVTISKDRWEEDWVSDTAGILEVTGRHAQLESFRMYAINNKIALSLLIIAPVASCSRLQTLDIWVGGQTEITDDDVEFLASRLPLLVCLRLVPSRGSVKTAATLRAFAIVAKWCPSITSVALQVDARASVPSLRLDKRHRNLRLVDVRRSHISHSRSVATFFDELSEVKGFRIAYLRLDRGKDPQRQRVWKEVATWLPILRKIRGSE
ncbi:hypothetical protein FRB95_014545 [Tulasnella sp. JGI-2019a]|nr:hypothetical protein FRB95_014545 [Tulasnella sp. JGI-2019a]